MDHRRTRVPRRVGTAVRAGSASIVLVLATVWMASGVQSRTAPPSAAQDRPPPPSAVVPIPLVDDGGAVVHRIEGDARAYLRVWRDGLRTERGRLPDELDDDARLLACLRCPDRVLVGHSDGRLQVLDFTAGNRLEPYIPGRLAGLGPSQPMVALARDGGDAPTLRAAVDGSSEYELGAVSISQDVASYHVHASEDGQRVLAALRPDAVRVGAVDLSMFSPQSPVFEVTVPLAVSAVETATRWAVCLDRAGHRYAIIRPSGGRLAATVAPFREAPVGEVALPLAAGSAIQGCGFVGDRLVVYGTADDAPDVFSVVVVEGGDVAKESRFSELRVPEVSRAAVCERSGLMAIDTQNDGTLTVDVDTLVPRPEAGILLSGCTPSGTAYLLAESALSWL